MGEPLMAAATSYLGGWSPLNELTLAGLKGIR